MRQTATYRCLLPLALALTALVAPPLGQLKTEPTSVLERARRAAGWSVLTPGACLRLERRVQHRGVEGTLSACFAQNGRFQQAFAGELTREARYDGADVRLAEYSSIWHRLELFAREAELLRAWVHGGYWLDPSAPLSITVAEQHAADDGSISLELRIRGGELVATLALDAREYLVRTLEIPSGNGVLRTDYSEHAAVEGLRVARRVRGDLSLGSEYTLSALEARLEGVTDSVFTQQPDVPDFRFDERIEPEVEVVRSSSKHLFVRPLVNGKDVGLFLFDTGAGFSGISVAAADALGLDPFGSSSLTGLGGQVTSTRMRRAGTLQLGPLIIEDLIFSEIPVAHKEAMVGERVAGVLGWDVMRRAIVDLEPRGVLRLHDPSSFWLPEDDWRALSVHYKVPYIDARFADGGQGLFMLDCGAAGMTVMFFHHAARSLGFLEHTAQPASMGHGAGGAFQHRLDELAWFEFTGERLDDLTIVVSTAEDGEADPYSLGLIGGGLLRLYRLIFDYPNQRVAILPL